MRKKTIVRLFIWSVALTVGGLIIGIAAEIIYSMADYPISTTLGLSELLIVPAVLILYVIVWIGTLIRQGKQQEWVWFVCTLLFGNFITFIYLLAVPDRPFLQTSGVGASDASLPQAGYPASGFPPSIVQVPPTPPSALDVLGQRFARGEIDAETYQHMRAMLENRK